MNTNYNTGFAIVMAWPATYCKQAGAWYDTITRFLGINKNFFYKAGHAAIILINKENAKCYYYDFGRYHAPLGYGRVRSIDTDNELTIQTKAIIKNNEIKNFKQILIELQSKPVFHGDGILHASYTPINFQLAQNTAKHLQENSPIVYGPFTKGGNNCSRFVFKVLNASTKFNWSKLKLNIFIPLTPTPLTNVKSFPFYTLTKKQYHTLDTIPTITDKNLLYQTKTSPQKHPNIPNNAQWLSGEGYGSWFSLSTHNNIIIAKRFSPKGVLECQKNYKTPNGFDIKKHFLVTHLSHCKQVSLIQNNQTYILSTLVNQESLNSETFPLKVKSKAIT